MPRYFFSRFIQPSLRSSLAIEVWLLTPLVVLLSRWMLEEKRHTARIEPRSLTIVSSESACQTTEAINRYWLHDKQHTYYCAYRQNKSADFSSICVSPFFKAFTTDSRRVKGVLNPTRDENKRRLWLRRDYNIWSVTGPGSAPSSAC